MSQNAIITFVVDGEPTNPLLVPRGTTFAEVRQRWAEASGNTGDVVFCLQDSAGALLPEEGFVSDLVPPEKLFLTLLVFRAEEKTVRVVGSTREEPLVIQVQALETAEELTTRVKALLGVEDRVARLLSGGRVLDAGAPACAQLRGCRIVELDLQVRFLAACLDPSSEPAAGLEMRAVDRFASEPARALTGDDDCRVTSTTSGESLSGKTPLSELLMEDTLRSRRPQCVFLERRMTVFVEDKVCGRSGARELWPTSKLSALRSSFEDVLIFHDEEVDCSLTAWTAGLREGACLILTRTGSVSVVIEGGKLRCLS